VSLLRDSAAGINARFHLVGLYTLVDLLISITLSLAGDDPAWGGPVVTVFLLAWGATFGILGLVYHAAAGREGRPSFTRYAVGLFLPLFWLQVKLFMLTYGPAVLAAWSYHRIDAPADQPLETWMPLALHRIEPIAGLAVLILALYGTPLSILYRERRQRGAPIRDGLRLLRARPAESVRLLGPVLLIALLAAVVHYRHGPERIDPVPDVGEGIVLLVTSYLYLVVFFGATRVVLGRMDLTPLRVAPPDVAARAPDPPA